jgi:hypothetical protein
VSSFREVLIGNSSTPQSNCRRDFRPLRTFRKSALASCLLILPAPGPVGSLMKSGSAVAISSRGDPVKIGRNQPCSCGSGKKFKHCHGRFDQASPNPHLPDIKGLIQRQQAEERIRQAQQGEGKPIISLKWSDHQIVAVGNTLHWSKAWKTFVDFLGDYMKDKLGRDWGNAEIAKPLADRHTILQWFDGWLVSGRSTLASRAKSESRK